MLPLCSILLAGVDASVTTASLTPFAVSVRFRLANDLVDIPNKPATASRVTTKPSRILRLELAPGARIHDRRRSFMSLRNTPPTFSSAIAAILRERQPRGVTQITHAIVDAPIGQVGSPTRRRRAVSNFFLLILETRTGCPLAIIVSTVRHRKPALTRLHCSILARRAFWLCDQKTQSTPCQARTGL